MVAAIALVLVGLVSVQGSEISEKTWEKLHRYSLLSLCYGEDAMSQYDVLQYTAMKKCGLLKTNTAATIVPIQTQAVFRAPSSTYPLTYNPFISQAVFAGRRKRQTLKPTAEDELDFLNDLATFTGTLESKMAALTCVLKEMGMLNANGAVDTSAWTYESIAAEMAGTKAGKDPAFVKHIADNWGKCADLYNAWPASTLDTPFKAQYGRMIVYINCIKKAEDNSCAKFLMHKHLESMFGAGATAKPGMPVDKYDAAALAVKVMSETATPEEMCVDDFFWGKPMSIM